MIQLTLTLKMTTAQVVETSVTVNDNSPIQDYVNPDDQTQPASYYGEAICHLTIPGGTLLYKTETGMSGPKGSCVCGVSV